MRYNPCSMDAASPHMILASGSPRRLEILRAHGFEPQVVVPSVDEDALLASWPEALSTEALVRRLAEAKAQAAKSAQFAHLPLLAADTIVQVDDYPEARGILGKPSGHDEAVKMLQFLSGKTHTVVTGVAIIAAHSGELQSFSDVTRVTFDEYDLDEIEHYLALEPPFDKAGSYAIQGYWKKHVAAIEGDVENVIGLPFYRIEGYLRSR